MVVYKLINNYASLQMSLAYKLEVLNRENDNAISKVCDTQINFANGQIQTNNLKGSSIFFRDSIKQRLGKIVIANFNTVCSINLASYVTQ